MLRLPVDDILPRAVESLEAVMNLVVQATPGSGKTTRIPPALLGARFTAGREVLVLEPRRLAAKLSARRVAEERGEQVGATVGYQFRFENVGSAKTRLRFLTEGMLMRRLMSDPELKGVAAVVVDEFHERHLQGDLALGYLRWLQRGRRPDLRIVVMSATLDTRAVSAFLGDCPVIEVDARLHPVEIEHLASPPSRRLEDTVREAVARAPRNGDMLVFLPGMADIRRAESALTGSGLLVLPLHGELSREEQDIALKPAGRTKVILATNVAETSLTIEGVTTVIDSGLHRSASYSWWSGVPALRTRPISRASAIQRAGRAGRTGPGRCLRLYTRGDFDGRAQFETPEIRRADLTQAVLELLVLGVADPAAFPWFEAPPPGALAAAMELLRLLGAVKDGALTELGRELSRVPAHPRLARALVEASQGEVLEEVATICALLQEGELEQLDAIDAAKTRLGGILGRTRDQLIKSVTRRYAERSRTPFCLLAGFPDRVAQRRGADLVFSAGGSAKAPELAGELFVVLDAQEMQRLGQARAEVKIRSVVHIEDGWLFDLEPTQLVEREDLEWDGKRVVAASRLAYGELTLSESRGRPKDREAAAKVLLKNLSLESFAVPAEIEEFFARVELLEKHEGTRSAPRAELLAQAIAAAVGESFSLEELKKADLPALLAGALEPEAAAKLGQLLPREIPLGKRKGVRVGYKSGQSPWVESRMQDFFGLKQGPSLLAGRLPLTLHLLAPNHRAVQVTSDLAGFWERAYPAARKELCRHYPRHYWPENPLEAEPDRLVPRKKR